ncbi:hypothetical protein ACWDAQ_28220, partial [Streptomyces sp. NPDC001139]
MRITRMLGAAALLFGLTVTPAVADSSPSPSASGDDSAPTSAGTSFRTAAVQDFRLRQVMPVPGEPEGRESGYQYEAYG